MSNTTINTDRLNAIFTATPEELARIATASDLAEYEVHEILNVLDERRARRLRDAEYQPWLKQFAKIVNSIQNHNAVASWVFSQSFSSQNEAQVLLDVAESPDLLIELINAYTSRNGEFSHRHDGFDKVLVDATDRLLAQRPELADDVLDEKIGNYVTDHVGWKYTEDRERVAKYLRRSHYDRKDSQILAERFADDPEFAVLLTQGLMRYSSGEGALIRIAQLTTQREAVLLIAGGFEETGYNDRVERYVADDRSIDEIAIRYANDREITDVLVSKSRGLIKLAKHTTDPELLARFKQQLADTPYAEEGLTEAASAQIAYGFASRGTDDPIPSDVAVVEDIVRVGLMTVNSPYRSPFYYNTLFELTKSTANPEILTFLAGVDDYQTREAISERAGQSTDPLYQTACGLVGTTQAVRQQGEENRAEAKLAREIERINTAYSGDELASTARDNTEPVQAQAARTRLTQVARGFEGMTRTLSM